MIDSTEVIALVRGALADLGAGPGVLADYLEENDHCVHGQLLRRRWKLWLGTQSYSEPFAERHWWQAERDTNAFRNYLKRIALRFL